MSARPGSRPARIPLPRMPRAENSFATTTPPSPSPPEALQPQPVVAPPSVPEHNPAPTAPTAAPPLTEDGLRPRLRLTPTATDQEFTAVFNTAVARPTSEPAPVPDEGWTWKELLGGLESEPTATTDAEALIHEIEMMGIDPAALLPKARVEAIAAAVQTGDSAGAREVVRALAPAAIRRLARRLVTDPGFNGKVAAFVLQRTAAVTEIIARDRQGFEIIQDLTTGPGRAYLLLDAAMIDGT